jgi:hypothetical protein
MVGNPLGTQPTNKRLFVPLERMWVRQVVTASGSPETMGYRANIPVYELGSA